MCDWQIIAERLCKINDMKAGVSPAAQWNCIVMLLLASASCFLVDLTIGGATGNIVEGVLR